MKKVLYLSYDGMTDPLGQSQVLPYIEGLSKKGYVFTLVSFEKPARFEKEKGIIETIAKRANINWVPLTYTKHPPFLSKIYDRWRLRRKVSQLYAREKFDMTHCRSYVAAEIGLALKKRHGVKFLFDMRGFWADEKVDSGQWDLKRPLYRRVYQHYKKKEKEFLTHADAVVSLTSAAKKEMHSKDAYRGLSIDVIPCCADLGHFDYRRVSETETEKLKSTLGIAKDKKVICYLGSVGGWYMTNEMFAFFRRLSERYPDFVMLLLTKDPPESVIPQITAAGIDPAKVIIRYAPRKELPAFISLTDCSIFFIRPTYSKMASSPTKHAELMGMGTPVICNDIGDTGSIIIETETGIVVDNFTNDDYDRAISRIQDLLLIPPEKIREAAYNYFDLDQGIKHYESIYARIFND